ncbi:hypothetical protein BT67DRAFT_444717 [Trichocladium antarcticum]|uniref:Uncharacterized protein n=1 Tax=Trichocladium antarcticum TaxID=1450529 RepID=A0AAN6ZA45_9PEZI|nr:hypothetical protein BT67DRAFT_444717 [Trichocladium antarcticum]
MFSSGSTHYDPAPRCLDVQYSAAGEAAPSRNDRNWFRAREGALWFPPPRSKKGTKGPRPLVAMCLRVLADNFGATSAEMIAPLPLRLKVALWKELAPRNMSLHAWSILSAELSGDAVSDAQMRVSAENRPQDEITIPMGLYRYCQEIIDPPCELRVYTSPLRGLSMHCLAYLCIDDIARFETHELLSLAKLELLAVLELIAREPMSGGISDRLIRGWRETKPLAFPGLRVLKITSRTHEVSEASLEYVFEFPRLEIFDVTALPASRWRKAERIANTDGWMVTRPEDSLFVSYAKAYLHGGVDVQITSAEGLRALFENDRQEVSLGYDPPFEIYSREKELKCSDTYLDKGWREVLQGARPLLAATNNSHQSRCRRGPSESDNDVFWFMALLAQTQYDGNSDHRIQRQAAGVTLQREQLVSLRLSTSLQPSAEQRQLLNSDRVIFSRPLNWNSKAEQTSDTLLQDRGRALKTSQTGPPHLQEHRATDLKPRKRQKLGDMLSSFGV